jgi:oligopeptide transport system ATP-binding protein
LEVKDLKISFRTSNGTVKAVRDISFDLQEGETLCIVGESGSGKSVTAKAILGILAGNSIVEGGEILYDGKDLLKISENEFNRIRGNDITMIFQDPMSSLDPIMRIGKQMTEATILNGKTNCKNAKKRFNQGLKQLKKDLEAVGQQNVQPQLEAFEKAAREGGKRRKTYQTAVEYAESALTALEHLTVDLYKNDETLVRGDAKSLADKLDHVTDDLFLKKDDPALADLLTRARKLEKDYTIQNRAAAETLAETGKALLTKALDAPRPDFCPDLDQKFVKTVSDALPDGADRLDRLKDAAFDMVNVVTKQMAYDKAIRIMEDVGIKEPEKRFNQFPFEFSGGMRQRIVIAIAIAANPNLLICDEPTTALDVTIQAQIMELINEIKRKRKLSVIFITHDLGVVANMADKVAVMYAGKIVEYGTADDIFYEPAHPYTWALLASMPDLDTKEKLEAIPGTPPNMIYPPVGDAFAERNKYAMQIDFEQQPPMFRISDTHCAATWLLHPDAPKVDPPKAVTDRIARMKELEVAADAQ